MGAEYIKREYRIDFVNGWGINVSMNRVEFQNFLKKHPKISGYKIIK